MCNNKNCTSHIGDTWSQQYAAFLRLGAQGPSIMATLRNIRAEETKSTSQRSLLVVQNVAALARSCWMPSRHCHPPGQRSNVFSLTMLEHRARLLTAAPSRDQNMEVAKKCLCERVRKKNKKCRTQVIIIITWHQGYIARALRRSKVLRVRRT